MCFTAWTTSPGASFTLGANHGCAFGDAAQSFAEIARAADEGNFEGVLVHVMSFVGGGEDFRFVNIVHTKFLQNLGFGKVADAALRHNRNGNGGHDFADLFRRGHAGHSAFGADLRGHALEGHDRNGPGFLGDFGLRGVGDVHDDAAFQHFCQAGLEAEAGGVVGRFAIVLRHVVTLFSLLLAILVKSAHEGAPVLSLFYIFRSSGF